MYPELLSKENVVGYGRGILGDDEVVTVLVSRKLPLAALASVDVIPAVVYSGRVGELLATDVLEVGFIRALDINRKARHRPAPGGVSIGHYKITAGTFGVLVFDNLTGRRLILSNNHVLANSNDAQIGDAILQPGPADGGRVGKDEIATLERFKTIEFGQSSPTCPIAGSVAKVLNAAAQGSGSAHRLEAVKVNAQAVNRVDAAVASPMDPLHDVLHKIIDVGIVNQITEVGLGDEVTKSGRTTETTTGNVLVVDATVQVSYGASGMATFEGQIIAGPMSAGGDSGSLGVVLGEGSGDEAKAFGLLFAGSEQVTIFNPIEDVLLNLDIRF